METLVLTTPVVTPEQSTTTYRVVSLTLDLERPSEPPGQKGLVLIQLWDNLDRRVDASYTGQVAVDMIKVLNTANLTIKSLHKRVLEKLIADGYLAGTVQGAPDP